MSLQTKTRAILTTIEAAEYLGVSRRFLDLDRFHAGQEGVSPKVPFVKMGYRTVKYRKLDLDAYLDSCLVK